MRKLFLSFVCFFMVHGVFAQAELTWDDFADATFKAEYNEEYGVNFLIPTFGEILKSYKGKQISITGYFLDFAGDGEILLVSQNPMASCFFCGVAGPETIIEVQFKEKPSFKTDQIIKVTGILDLNRDDVDHCNYILKEAVGKPID